MKKILAVFTGGTIGSRVQDGAICLRSKDRYAVLERYEKKHPGKALFETEEPFQILSENLQFQHMAELVRFLKEKHINGYDGVIVAHGTDTLPYTAAYLGYYFGKAKVPVLLVSSNYALEEAGSNGEANFEAAVDFICEGHYAGVFVPYQNGEEEPVSFFLATRLLEADGYADRFHSFDGGRLGSMQEGRFVYEERKENPPLSAFLKDADKGGSKEDGAWIEDSRMEPKVLNIHPYPGLSYERIALGKEVQAVFHGAYHSGTACAEGEGENAALFVKRAAKEGIPIYFGPVKKKEAQYETARAFLAAGGNPVYDCSEIAAYVKLLIGCGLGKCGEELKAFMKEVIYYERIERTEGRAYEKKRQQ